MTGWITPELIWFVCGVVMIFLEFMLPGVILVFFGIGAVITSILVWVGLLPSPFSQLVVFGVTSLGLLFGLRKYASKFFKGGSTEEENDEYSGKPARVTQKIVPNELSGKVFFEGSDWKADSQEIIEEGASVKVIGKNNITLIVEKQN